MTSEMPVLVLALVLGLCIGSFLNVCVSRWPAGLSVVRPPSRCPRCARPIRALENIPVVSWLLLRGRCRGCALPISIEYPLVELAVGLVWMAAAWRWGGTLLAVRVAVFATLLLGISLTDLRHYIIPDGFTVSGLLWTLLIALLARAFGDAGETTLFATPYDAIIGACVGAGIIAIVGWLGEVALGREAMGFGDVTLMAFVGAALGPARTLLTVFVGAALGAAIFLLVVYPVLRLRTPRTGQGELFTEGSGDDALPQVPFGVFLAPAALLTLLWGDRAIAWYLANYFPA